MTLNDGEKVYLLPSQLPFLWPRQGILDENYYAGVCESSDADDRSNCLTNEFKPEPNQSPEKKDGAMVALARYSYLAMVLPSSAFAGWLIGALLEKWLHAGWLHIAGLIFGIIAGFVELGRAAFKLGSEK